MTVRSSCSPSGWPCAASTPCSPSWCSTPSEACSCSSAREDHRRGESALEVGDDLLPAAPVRVVRRVEADAGDHVAVASVQLGADLLRLTHHGEGVEHLVVDERAHL